MELNGHKQIPAVTVHWDEETQNVGLTFDRTAFKTWDFVIAVLEMGKARAEAEKRAAQMAQMQQQMAEAQMAEKIGRSLRH